jgi:dihydrofolate reductase
MKIQVAAIVSTDGYLLLNNHFTTSFGSGKYGFRALQERSDLVLYKESSLIALLEEKRQTSDSNYLIATASDTLDLVKGLFLYRLVDELILYQIPLSQNTGFRLFDFTDLSEWKLVKTTSLKNQCRHLLYKTIR